MFGPLTSKLSRVDDEKDDCVFGSKARSWDRAFSCAVLTKLEVIVKTSRETVSDEATPSLLKQLPEVGFHVFW